MKNIILKSAALALALILGLMCLTVSAASVEPTITVFGNEASPAIPESEVNMYIRLSDFSSVAGMDLTLTAQEGIVFTGVTSDDISLTEKNHTLTEKELHIVDLTHKALYNIDVTAKVYDTAAAGEYTVTFTGILAGKDGKTKLSEGTLATATVVVREAEKTAQTGTLAATDGMFIPYGSVYNSSKNFIDKDEAGKFNVAAGDKYTQFRFGKNGITTFGTSYALDNTAVQFGTYANGKSGKEFGTMCILGDWEGFKSYYRSQKGYSEAQLTKLIFDRYDTLMAENSDATHVIMKCNNKTVEIHVYKVAQTKYMWGKEHSTDLQYALRVKDIEQGEKYAAIGYYTKSGETILSTEIETVEVQ